MSVLLGVLLSVECKAAASEWSYFDEYIKDAPFWPEDTRIEKVPDYTYDYYRMQLDEHSLVTLTLDDPSKFSRSGAALLQDDGSENGRIIAVMNATKEDGDESKTVLQLQLRAGLYYVRIDRSDGQPYNAIYTVAPLKSSIDVEPNNMVQQANPISLNTPIKNIGNVGALKDYYTFTLDETSKVTLRTEKYMPQLSTASSQLLYVNVDDDKGNRYLATLTSPVLAQSATEVLPPGRYTVEVDGDSGYNQAYQFILKTEAIVQPETYKNSIFGTTLKAGNKIRGFLGRNDEYYFTLDHDQKVTFTITTDSKELMSATLTKANATGEYLQITDYKYEQQQGLFTMTAQLQAGDYKIEPNTHWAQIGEVNYTIRFDEVAYSDVPITHRYYKEIKGLSAQGIIQGYPDGQFKPTNSITRRQVFTMLSRFDLNLTPIREMIQFKDLIRSSADYQLILPFYSAGIVDGSYGRMNLSSNLTRAQLAKILVNTFDLKMQGTSPEFKDVSSKHYAYEYIQILASNGITNGSYGYFMPNEPVSREHFSVFLYRLFENMKES